MPKIDLAAIEPTGRTGYPPPFAADVAGRTYRRMTAPGGLSDFGANHVTLAPGAWSSQRHWHEGEDEFLVMLTGEAVLIEETGRTAMRPGDCAAFPKDRPNGHHLVNESDGDCTFVVVGANAGKDCHYPDIDLVALGAEARYVHKDGTPY